MINVNGIKRNAKNIVKKYSDAQVKVREATSNDPWGPSSTIMAEIADLTYNVVAFSEIMQMIWKRLNDHGKNWRHVYKALVLLEYLIKTGTEKVAQQCTENVFAIQTLKDFQYMEDSKDYGMNIREKSKKLVALLKDSEKLKAERARALKAKARLAEAMSSVSKNSLGSMMSAGMNGDNSMLSAEGNNAHSAGPSASHLGEGTVPEMAGSDLDSARPQSLTEEENQLRLALALSKEEAEQQEKTRKHDELRLKLALDVSKKTTASTTATTSSDLLQDFGEPSTSGQQVSIDSDSEPEPVPVTNGQSKSKSAIDDLLGLSIPPTSETAPKLPITSMVNSQPTMKSIQPCALSNNPLTSVFLEPNNDPWSVDPWQAASATTLPQSSQYTAPPTIRPQQAANSNLNSSGLSTLATNSMATTVAPTLSSMAFATLSESNGFSINNNGTSNAKTLSKNPFQD